MERIWSIMDMRYPSLHGDAVARAVNAGDSQMPDETGRRRLMTCLENVRNKRTKKCGAVISVHVDCANCRDAAKEEIWCCRIARLLSSGMGGNDAVTLAVLDNREFAVLLQHLDERYSLAVAQANRAALEILLEYERPWCQPCEGAACRPAIGVFVFDSIPLPGPVILGNARFAMYLAIAAGRSAVRFYDPVAEALLAG